MVNLKSFSRSFIFIFGDIEAFLLYAPYPPLPLADKLKTLFAADYLSTRVTVKVWDLLRFSPDFFRSPFVSFSLTTVYSHKPRKLDHKTVPVVPAIRLPPIDCRHAPHLALTSGHRPRPETRHRHYK